MLRWKLFVPLAVVLTAAGLLGSYFWSASASARYLSTLENQAVADITIDGDDLIISLKTGQALPEILEELNYDQLAKISGENRINFVRIGKESTDSSLNHQVDLILAQAIATREYYAANLLLKDLAAEWGYSADMVIWQDMVVAEIGDSQESYIASSVREVGP